MEDCFQSFGSLDSVRVFPGKTYAFVNFMRTADAAVAKDTLDGVPRPAITGTRPMIIRFQADSYAAAAAAKQEAKASSLGRDSPIFDPSIMLKVCQTGMELAEEVKGQQSKLSNRLNPNNIYFDPDLAERYKRMSKMEKEMLWEFDRRVRSTNVGSGSSVEPSPNPPTASSVSDTPLPVHKLLRSSQHHSADFSPYSSQPCSPRSQQQPSSPTHYQRPPPPPSSLSDHARRAPGAAVVPQQHDISSGQSSFAQLAALWPSSAAAPPSRLSGSPPIFPNTNPQQPILLPDRGSAHGAVGTRLPAAPGSVLSSLSNSSGYQHRRMPSADTEQPLAMYDSFAVPPGAVAAQSRSETGADGGGAGPSCDQT
uniref:RRM domain-containing protein n=1 Tax=Tetraselmis chuii TaxID=63592 RepID=A0A7S1X277_9CHLO|mmetsp:Transcript_20757/g.37051  ORF Transcript_20757/g.37051 Transcript_20757/m.37051 type:complete len:367 (+) Transcript_20757:310-1410(+)